MPFLSFEIWRRFNQSCLVEWTNTQFTHLAGWLLISSQNQWLDRMGRYGDTGSTDRVNATEDQTIPNTPRCPVGNRWREICSVWSVRCWHVDGISSCSNMLTFFSDSHMSVYILRMYTYIYVHIHICSVGWKTFYKLLIKGATMWVYKFMEVLKCQTSGPRSSTEFEYTSTQWMLIRL